jgi:outer membrane protein
MRSRTRHSVERPSPRRRPQPHGAGIARKTPAPALISRLSPSLCLACILGAGSLAPARADTLADAIALAYHTNPTLVSERAQLRALDESYVQARSGYRPQVSATLEGDYSNDPSTLQEGVQDASASVSLSQPIYTGGQTSAEVHAAVADINAGRQKLRAAEQGVLQSVIQAYVDLRRDLQVLAIAEDNVTVLVGQLDQTRAELEVGQVSRTDVSQAEARLAAARAQLSSAKAQVALSQANYAAVVGQDPGPLAPEPVLPGIPTSVDQVIDTALANNPAILAAGFAEQSASARVAAAKSAYRPTAALRAQLGYSGYYTTDAFLGVRSGVYDRNIEASVVVTEPLFAGGMNASRIRQALEEENVQLAGMSAARRQTLQAVAQAWNQLLAARANTASNTEQVSAAEQAYAGVRAEAEVGARTTLDVLNAEREYHAAEVELVNARHDEYVAGASVLNAMGLLEANNLGMTGPLYHPEAAFNHVKRDGAVPWEGLVSAVDSIGMRPADSSAASAAAPAKAEAAPVQAGGPAVQ